MKYEALQSGKLIKFLASWSKVCKDFFLHVSQLNLFTFGQKLIKNMNPANLLAK